MVINISKLIEKDYDYINKEISTIMTSLSSDIIFKLIIETCYLSDETIIDICNIAVNNGVHFVKTSTGFGSNGADTNVIALMKKTVGKNAEIKASGGIRDFETAMSMIKCGATRLGTSSGIKIIGESL
jgi:deoxyribose-phosphate aldolase